MLVLGISDFDHDTAACLMDADGPIAAVEEDKLTRSAAAGIPQMAIARCLEEAVRARQAWRGSEWPVVPSGPGCATREAGRPRLFLLTPAPRCVIPRTLSSGSSINCANCGDLMVPRCQW